MLRMPLTDIITKIKEKSGLSEDEIKGKIKKKMEELSGLISQEGSAHIIANELGIKLFEDFGGKLQIKNILSGMRNVEVAGKVTQIFETRDFEYRGSKGKVANLVIGDETGSIRVVLWHKQTDNLAGLKVGDTIKVTKSYVRENNGRMELHLSPESEFALNPEGIAIKEVKSAAMQKQAERKQIKELKGGETGVELLGTILQVFELRFYETCPECSKRAKQTEKGIMCEQHGVVNPDYGYVINFFLDDGTETVRVVAFRDQVERLLGKTKTELLSYKDSPEKFNQLKTELLGNIVLVNGRANKNELYDRLEFVANAINPKPNPHDEIKRLEEAKKQTT